MRKISVLRAQSFDMYSYDISCIALQVTNFYAKLLTYGAAALTPHDAAVLSGAVSQLIAIQRQLAWSPSPVQRFDSRPPALPGLPPSTELEQAHERALMFRSHRLAAPASSSPPPISTFEKVRALASECQSRRLAASALPSVPRAASLEHPPAAGCVAASSADRTDPAVEHAPDESSETETDDSDYEDASASSSSSAEVALPQRGEFVSEPGPSSEPAAAGRPAERVLGKRKCNSVSTKKVQGMWKKKWNVKIVVRENGRLLSTHYSDFNQFLLDGNQNRTRIEIIGAFRASKCNFRTLPNINYPIGFDETATNVGDVLFRHDHSKYRNIAVPKQVVFKCNFRGCAGSIIKVFRSSTGKRGKKYSAFCKNGHKWTVCSYPGCTQLSQNQLSISISHELYLPGDDLSLFCAHEREMIRRIESIGQGRLNCRQQSGCD